MRTELEKYADEVVPGSFRRNFWIKRGKEEGPTIMVAGHMDEVGFMVTSITDNGMLRFQTLGGW